MNELDRGMELWYFSFIYHLLWSADHVSMSHMNCSCKWRPQMIDGDNCMSSIDFATKSDLNSSIIKQINEK